MAFNNMQSLGPEAREWIPEVEPVFAVTTDLKRQIAEMQTAALRGVQQGKPVKF
jgi:hypothetical protein